MTSLILEKGARYDFLKKLDPRYALRLSNLFGRRFSCLEEITKAVKKDGIIDEKFYVPGLSLNAISPNELPVYYFLLKFEKEVARIKLVE